MIKERISKYLDFKGISKYKFYQETGFSNGFLDKEGAIGSDKCEKIYYSYPEINLQWLLTGKGEMLKSSTEPQTEPKGVPLIPLEAFAGKGFELQEGVNFDTIEERYNVPLFKGLQVDFMIPVKGSSMYPKYASGDVVACRMVKDLLFIQWNKVYVIDSESQGTLLKRLKKSDNEDFVTCKSDNKDYEEFDIPKADIRNIALVVGVIRLE